MNRETLITKLKKSGKGSKSARLLFYRYKEIIDPFPYRRYLRKNKCVFVHIPKTAGTAVLKALGHSGPRDHSTYREFLKSNPVRFNNYFKFGFVRNPYSRFISTYKYLKGGGNNSVRDQFYKELIDSECPTVNEFVSYVINNELYQADPLLWPQHMYLCNPLGEVMVDFVGQYESLEIDFEVIAKSLGLDNKLEKVNVSSDKDFLTISEKSLKRLTDIYKKDFYTFGYRENSY